MEKLKQHLPDLGLLWLRILMGLGIAYHGSMIIFSGMLPKMIEGVTKMGFPAPEIFAWAAALSQFAGGILTIFGFLARPAAFFIFCTMSVAAFIAHKADPFQVKELAFAYWAISGALILTGPGKYSVDRKIFQGK